MILLSFAAIAWSSSPPARTVDVYRFATLRVPANARGIPTKSDARLRVGTLGTWTLRGGAIVFLGYKVEPMDVFGQLDARGNPRPRPGPPRFEAHPTPTPSCPSGPRDQVGIVTDGRPGGILELHFADLLPRKQMADEMVQLLATYKIGSSYLSVELTAMLPGGRPDPSVDEEMCRELTRILGTLRWKTGFKRRASATDARRVQPIISRAP